MASTTAGPSGVVRGALVSTIGHLAIAVVAVVAALDSRPDPSATSFWLLAGFGILGSLAAAVLWARTRSGAGTYAQVSGTVIALLVASVIPATAAAVREGSATLVVIPLLLIAMNAMLLRSGRSASRSAG